MRVAFRVDASRTIGFGHITRCLALADALRGSGAQTEFLCAEITPELEKRLRAAGHDLTDLASVDAVAMATSARDWVVFDHYSLDASNEAQYRADGARVLVIDDLANRSHECDMLVDHNHYRDGSRYTNLVPPTCRLLLGPRYALLGAGFDAQAPRATSPCDPVRRILVAFGGTDAPNFTTAVVAALAELGGTHRPAIDVVIGAQNPHRQAVAAACDKVGAVLHVQTDKMAELLVAADIAIGAGGVSTLERWVLGVPSIVYPIADNQMQLTDDAARDGLIYAPDGTPFDRDACAAHVRALMRNSALRRRLSEEGMALVDGRGVKRVGRAMMPPRIHARIAAPEDSEKLWAWRNHASVREASLDPREIPRREHDNWFANAMSDPDKAVLIVEDGSDPVGVVRFDVDQTRATISIYRVPSQRSAGMGGTILDAAEDWLRKNRPDVRQVDAIVRQDNDRSRRLFRESGYRLEGMRFTKEVER